MLVHVVDAAADDPVRDYRIVKEVRMPSIFQCNIGSDYELYFWTLVFSLIGLLVTILTLHIDVSFIYPPCK